MKKIIDKIIPTSISSKLSIFVSVVVIVTFTFFESYNFIILKSEITEQIHTEQYTQAKFIAKDIQIKLAKRTKFLSALADIIPPNKMQSEDFLTDILKNHLNFTDFFPQGFAVIKADGQGLIAEYPELPGRKNLTLTEIEWFVRAKNSQDIIISVPFRSLIVDKILVVIAKALRDENGQVLAVLEAPIFLNTPGFIDYIFDENHKTQSNILVLSRTDEIFLASSIPSLLLKRTPEKGVNTLHDAVMDGFNGSGETINAFGKKEFAAAADISYPDWFVVIRTPAAKVYETLNENLRTAIFNGLLVSICTFFTITFALFLFFKPLRQAAKSVREMVLKKQSITHIESYNNDEIGDLISGFNSLGDMVNERSDKLEKANTALESLSQTDGLTQISNRRNFDDTLLHRWKMNTRSQYIMTLLLIDIDEFKKFNDIYGHLAGDDCLKKVAKIIKKSINRPTDFFARYGGEEFVILLQGDMQEGVAVADKVRLAVSNLEIPHTESSHNHVTISLGVASVIPQLNSQPGELIKQADIALYQSKERGRNRYEYYKIEHK